MDVRLGGSLALLPDHLVEGGLKLVGGKGT